MEMIVHLIMVSFGNITLTQTHGQNYHRTPVVLDGHLDLLFLDVMYILLGLIRDTNSFPSDLYKFSINENCGCTDENAFNFSAEATIDDGSCCYIGGCTDINAFNYNPDACYDDNSCTSINLGCTDPSFSDFDPDANIEVFTGGPTSLNEYGSGGYHFNVLDMIFNVLEDTYLSSVDVNAQNSGSITLDIISGNGSVFAQFDYNINPGWNTLSLETLIPQEIIILLVPEIINLLAYIEIMPFQMEYFQLKLLIE